MIIEQARAEHETQLRELLRESAMPGWIRVAFATEPDFFRAAAVRGRSNQVFVATAGERVLGMGCRSTKPVFINGRRADIGYLSGLRIRRDARGASILARAYRALEKAHDRESAPAYLTTIVESNTKARALLTSRRAGLPHYLDYGRYFTYAINLRSRRRPYSSAIAVRNGDEVGLGAILRFLGEEGRRRQFFPALDADDFHSGRLRELGVADFRVAVRGDSELVGVAAAWDQGAFKQHVVQGYAAPVRFVRPAVNVCLRAAGFRPLPAIGERIGAVHVAFPCVRNDDPAIFRALVERIYSEHRAGKQHFLAVGLHERDPLRVALRRFLAFRYTSRCYLVCWDDGRDFAQGLDADKIPYLELAAL